jgi:hypothetical protein
MHLGQIGLDGGAGKAAPLSADEYDAIVSALEAPTTPYEARRKLLTLSLRSGGPHDGLLQYCKTLLETTSAAPDFTGYEMASNLALQYLFAESPDRDSWVQKFEQSRSAVLKLVVAQHMFKTDPQRALIMMIETIPLAGTDHGVTDAIDLWLAHESNAQLLAAVDARLNGLTSTLPASVLTAAFRHARGVIADECS